MTRGATGGFHGHLSLTCLRWASQALGVGGNLKEKGKIREEDCGRGSCECDLGHIGICRRACRGCSEPTPGPSHAQGLRKNGHESEEQNDDEKRITRAGHHSGTASVPAWEVASSGGQDRQGGQKKGRSPGEDQALITISEAFARIGRSSVVDIEPLQLRSVPFGLCMACLATWVCCACALCVPSVRRDDGVVVIGAEHNWLAIRIECLRSGCTQAAAAAKLQLTEKRTPKNPDGGEQGRNDTVEEKNQQEDMNAKSNIRNAGGSFFY